MTIRLALLVALAVGGAASAAQPVKIDGNGPGRIFEGIGALSAGASSRLLIDYPEPHRSRILDLLFLPKYGASLQHLKIEIGGAVNSTDGSEPSHALTREEFVDPRGEYFNRGYEIWLAREARRRNQDIVLDCLMWGAPGWIGNGKFYSPDCADYVVSFLKGVEKYHGLRMQYTGIWNERWYDKEWIKLLRNKLDTAGLGEVKIVAADQVGSHVWTIVEDMMRDSALMDAIAVVGEHYPSGTSQGGSTPLAIASGKPLWSSEDSTGGSDWDGAKWMAHRFNGNYIRGRMTKTVVWSIITSYYDNLIYPGSGIMRANSPWSGNYGPEDGIWVVAHTTQFTAPGWRYMDGACGLLKGGGTFVTLRAPEPSVDWSLVAETLSATVFQEVSIELSGGLSQGRIAVWRSNQREKFVRAGEIEPREGVATVKLEPGAIYSLTTTTGQRKGRVDPPSAKPFPFPYRDGFERPVENRLPRYYSDQYGSFEVADRPDGTGKCLKQLVTMTNIGWISEADPLTVAGDPEWTDYQVSADCRLAGPGSVFIAGRVGKTLNHDAGPVNGFVLRLDSAGKWSLAAAGRVLDAGTVAYVQGRWARLELKFQGYNAIALIDGKKVGVGVDYACISGMVGLGSGRNPAEYDDVAVGKLSGELPAATGIRNLSRGARVTASSSWAQTPGDFGPRQACDGDRTGTRWNAKTGDPGEWLEVDLGARFSVERTITTQFYERITAYRIQAWDGAGWKDVCIGGKPGPGIRMDEFPTVVTDKVRCLVDASDGPPSLYEFEVIGKECKN